MLEDFPEGLLLDFTEVLEAVLEALLEAVLEAVPDEPPEAEEVTLAVVAPAEDPEAAGCWAAGFDVFEAHPAAERAIRALPARSA